MQGHGEVIKIPTRVFFPYIAQYNIVRVVLSHLVISSQYKLHPAPERLSRLQHEFHCHKRSLARSFLEVRDDGLLHDGNHANVNKLRQKFEIEH